MATSRDENLLNEKGARPGDQTDESIRDTVDSDLCIDVEAATVDAARHKDEHYDGTRQIVDFDGPHDPADPLHWPAAKKLSIVLNIAWLSAGGQMASSMIAPSVEQIIMEFHTTDLLLAVLIVSVFLIGMAVGLLLTSGLSEVYGRVPVTHATNVGFVVFGCAAAVSQSLGQLIGFRFLQGLMAATPPAVGGGVIGDLYKPKDRGRATSICEYYTVLIILPRIADKKFPKRWPRNAPRSHNRSRSWRIRDPNDRLALELLDHRPRRHGQPSRHSSHPSRDLPPTHPRS